MNIFVPDWVIYVWFSLTCIFLIGGLMLVALHILLEGFNYYFKRLLKNLEVTDVIEFGKEYREWKSNKQASEVSK